jgi:hypothetical protein
MLKSQAVNKDVFLNHNINIPAFRGYWVVGMIVALYAAPPNFKMFYFLLGDRDKTDIFIF